MATKAAFKSQNLFFRDTVLSPAIGASLWENCPLLALRSDPSIGTLYEQNFLGVTPSSDAIPGWTTTKVTSGAVTLDAIKGLSIDSGAVTAAQGMQMQLTSTAVTIASGKPVWLEASIRFEGQSSLKIQFLFGLCAIDTTLIAASAVDTTEKAAFDGVTTTGVIVSDCTLAATSGTGTGFTIVNNTVFKLGIYATTTAVQFWVNGAVVKTLTANIPTAAMSPSIVVQANATVQPICLVRWLRMVGIN